MEQRVNSNAGQPGFLLVTVMIVTAVGLLFGAGALLLFRYQCQLRIDRQHELEKVYAVRSAVNFLRTYDQSLPTNGVSFGYHTWSERDLGILVKPVAPIFPDESIGFTDPPYQHFVMEKARFFTPGATPDYNIQYDYEYGSTTDLVLGNQNSSGEYGLAVYKTNATEGATWWVNIGMRGTGGWLQEDYGRRYYFQPHNYIGGTNSVKDIMRLCLIREDATNMAMNVGARHGWPLSKEGQMALVFQIRPKAGGIEDKKDNADMTLSEYWHSDGGTKITNLLTCANLPTLCPMGMQLADNKVCLFYMPNDNTFTALYGGAPRGCIFSESVEMSPGMYEYFASGMVTNNGVVTAPPMRAVFEIEAAADRTSGKMDFLTDFRVTPAYQFDIFLEHPDDVFQLATVAQKYGKYNRDGHSLYDFTMLTYDTHGTEHKGFRWDEKHGKGGGGK